MCTAFVQKSTLPQHKPELGKADEHWTRPSCPFRGDLICSEAIRKSCEPKNLNKHPDRYPNLLDEQGPVSARGLKQMGQRPVTNCPSLSSRQFGTGVWCMCLKIQAQSHAAAKTTNKIKPRYADKEISLYTLDRIGVQILLRCHCGGHLTDGPNQRGFTKSSGEATPPQRPPTKSSPDMQTRKYLSILYTE